MNIGNRNSDFFHRTWRTGFHSRHAVTMGTKKSTPPSDNDTEKKHRLICEVRIVMWYHYQILQKPELYFDANFVVTGGTAGCRYDNLRCPQWRQGWHHDNSWYYNNKLPRCGSMKENILIKIVEVSCVIYAKPELHRVLKKVHCCVPGYQPFRVTFCWRQ